MYATVRSYADPGLATADWLRSNMPELGGAAPAVAAGTVLIDF